MFNEVYICNLALSHLGQSAKVSKIEPPFQNKESEICSYTYEIARDSLLEMHDWTFAIKKQNLARIENDHDSWKYCYVFPDDLIRLIGLTISKTDYNYDAYQYQIEINENYTKQVYTNEEFVVAHYVSKVKNSKSFSPNFVMCLSWYLASMLSGSIIKGKDSIETSTNCLNKFKLFLEEAKKLDANQSFEKQDYVAQSIKARI